MVVFGQKKLYSGKSGCNWASWLFGQSGYFGQSGCIRAKWLYSGCIGVKVVVFGQKLLYSNKVVVFGQKWLYLGKSGCIRAKVVVFG